MQFQCRRCRRAEMCTRYQVRGTLYTQGRTTNLLATLHARLRYCFRPKSKKNRSTAKLALRTMRWRPSSTANRRSRACGPDISVQKVQKGVAHLVPHTVDGHVIRVKRRCNVRCTKYRTCKFGLLFQLYRNIGYIARSSLGIFF